MKTFVKILIFILIFATIVCMLPAGAFFAIATVDKYYALRVNAFTGVDSVLDDYHTLADIITEKIGEGKISAGDVLFLGEGRMYIEDGKNKNQVNVSKAQREALKRLEEFRFDYNRVEVGERFYRIVSATDPTTLVYSVRGGKPSKTSPDNENLHYYSPKAVGGSFYVLVRDPNFNADYIKQGFEIVKMAYDKIKTFLKNR